MKPLGRKAYGSIGHLPQSRLGPGDHRVPDGQGVICLERARDRHDEIIVQEKLDGSCCSVAKVDGQVLALGRAGYLAQTSRFEQHQLFADWVRHREWQFGELLNEGERVVGEWLAMAHGTRYKLPHPPFVAFDIMRGEDRLPYDEANERLTLGGIVVPRLLHRGGPLSLLDMQRCIEVSGHGAIDPVEGAVYRVQRKGSVDYLAKWVRPDKQDGCYLPEVSGQEPIWHWRPRKAA